MAQNEPRFGMPARRFKLAQFDRNHWHNKTGIGGTNRTVLSNCRRNQKKQPPFKVYYQKFDFLKFTFKPRILKMHGKLKLGFTPAISQRNIARISDEIFKRKIHRWVHFPLSRIA